MKFKSLALASLALASTAFVVAPASAKIGVNTNPPTEAGISLMLATNSISYSDSSTTAMNSALSTTENPTVFGINFGLYGSLYQNNAIDFSMGIVGGYSYGSTSSTFSFLNQNFAVSQALHQINLDATGRFTIGNIRDVAGVVSGFIGYRLNYLNLSIKPEIGKDDPGFWANGFEVGIGAGARFSKSFEITAFYKANFASHKDDNVNNDITFNTFGLMFGYYIPSSL